MFTVRDVARSMAFYRDVLGFELEAKWPDGDTPVWANLMLGSQSVMIGASMSPDDPGCSHEMDAASKAYWRACHDDFTKNKSGAGVVVYLEVPDVDAFHGLVVKRGAKTVGPPTSQFYGIRDFFVQDPDGYRLMFYQPIVMTSCQSCGMPLKDAVPGVTMFCQYCTNEKGELRPYEQILEGTISGYFMAMQKMPRPEAEKAAREHLAKMPAWSHRK
jgi:uncharacterized glyoxalase superfamily protein PhnB